MSNRIVGKRRSRVIIEEWYRLIGSNNYKFNVTRWPEANEAVITVSRRKPGHGYLQCHLWRIKNGVITGTYHP